VLRVLQAGLVRAVRAISVERGTDPRDFTLMPFGGAGGLHAARLARQLGIRRILVPPAPGILCAYGALAADLRSDFGRTCLADADETGLPALRAAFTDLAGRAEEWLSGEGVEPDKADFAWTLELRYARQNYQLTVDVGGEPDAATLAEAVERFHARHEQRYGFAAPGEPVKVVTVRLAAVAPTPEIVLAKVPPAGEVRPRTTRPVYFDELESTVDCPVYERDDLGDGAELSGPAIISQLDSTTVVLPGQLVRVDSFGNLLIEESA
jgi:N-methylhydantoinase A